MASTSIEVNRRRLERTKAVLPVRVSGTDASGISFQEPAHTLDITPEGARLGAIRRELKADDKLTIQFRQRKTEFRVIWTRHLDGTREYQVGLQSTAKDRDAWS